MINKKTNNLNVSHIKAEKLFGLYDYTLPREGNIDINKLMIIYGDNGSGKTTILKLFFYLLSTRDKSGYKSRIAETKFKKFSVFFQNGFEIGAVREKATSGTYEFYISKNRKKIKSLVLIANSENAIQLESGTKDDFIYQEILTYIKKLNITIFYLSDDRKILNSLLSDGHEQESNTIIYNHSDIIYSREYEKTAIKKYLNEKRLGFEPTIERLIDWVRNKVIYGSRQGETNSQVIFSDIIKNYITLAESEVSNKTQETLLKELEDLEAKIPSFVKFGLIDNIDIKGFRSSIKKAKTPEQINFLHTVVSLFLDSINAKLNALEYVVKTINLFLQTVNDYFASKRIEFHLSKGFILKQTDNNEDINFNWLSSGEKQLILLLINTITSADDATIFIIDEPEISLNIKWQRKLINTLLDFSKEKNIQFILATHSFELLSSYKTSITKLVSENA
ncbi:AAA family ATPase [Chryseobacterium tongliaoense]|uniref:AAA family ATPase n=1 Tax=Chryseobacterium tongliaoense TaxID=3240933 RepID=UPI00351357C1